MTDRVAAQKCLDADELATVRKALAIGGVSHDGDGWYAANAGYGYDEAEATMTAAFAILADSDSLSGAAAQADTAPGGGLACGGCGGPHRFDTSVPSPLWNAVIRAAGLSDYLCTSCIVEAFVNAGRSFEAELYGPTVNREGSVPVIHVQVDDRPLDESYGDLQAQLRAALAAPSRDAGLDVERLRDGIEAELAGITEPVGPFESGAAAAYHFVLSLLASPADQSEAE